MSISGRLTAPCFPLRPGPGGCPVPLCETGGSFLFILCLFVLLKALNRVPQLRQRVEEGEVWEYESVNALVPVLAADGEFTQI